MLLPGLKERKRAHLKGQSKPSRRRDSAAAPGKAAVKEEKGERPAKSPKLPVAPKVSSKKARTESRDSDTEPAKAPAVKKDAVAVKKAGSTGASKPSHKRTRSDGSTTAASAPVLPTAPQRPRFADEFAGGMGLMQVFRCTFEGCPKWFYGKSQLKSHLQAHEESTKEDSDDGSEKETTVSRTSSRRTSERQRPPVSAAAGEDSASPRLVSSKPGTLTESGKGTQSSSSTKVSALASSKSAASRRGSLASSGMAAPSGPTGRKPSASAAPPSSSDSDSDDDNRKIVFEQPNKEGTLLVNGVATYPLCTFPKCNRWFYTKGQLRSHLKTAHGVEIELEGSKRANDSASERNDDGESVEDAVKDPVPVKLEKDDVPLPSGSETLLREVCTPNPTELDPPKAERAEVEASETEADPTAGQASNAVNEGRDFSASQSTSPLPKRGQKKPRTVEGRGVSANWTLGERPQRSMSPEEKERKRRNEADDLLSLDDFPRCRFPGCDKWFYSRGQLKAHERLHQEDGQATIVADAGGEAVAKTGFKATVTKPVEEKQPSSLTAEGVVKPDGDLRKRGSGSPEIPPDQGPKVSQPKSASLGRRKSIIAGGEDSGAVSEPAGGAAPASRPRSNSKSSASGPSITRRSNATVAMVSSHDQERPHGSRSRSGSFSQASGVIKEHSTDRLPPRRKTEGPKLDEVLLRMNALSKTAANPAATYGMGGRRVSERQRAQLGTRVLSDDASSTGSGSLRRTAYQEYDSDDEEWQGRRGGGLQLEGEAYEEEDMDTDGMRYEEEEDEEEEARVERGKRLRDGASNHDYAESKRARFDGAPHATGAKPGESGFDIVATLVSLREAPSKTRPKSPRPAGKSPRAIAAQLAQGRAKKHGSPFPTKSSPLASSSKDHRRQGEFHPAGSQSARQHHLQPAAMGAYHPYAIRPPEGSYVPWMPGTHVSLPAIVIPSGSSVRPSVTFYNTAGRPMQGHESPTTPSSGHSGYQVWYHAPATTAAMALQPVAAPASGPYSQATSSKDTGSTWTAPKPPASGADHPPAQSTPQRAATDGAQTTNSLPLSQELQRSATE